MPKRHVAGINAIPAPAIYSLSEGARVIGITDRELLHYASQGKIGLLIKLPRSCVSVSLETILVVKYQSEFRRYGRSDLERALIAGDRVDYLRLEQSDCVSIRSVGSEFRERFFSAYKVNGDGEVALREPAPFSNLVKEMLSQQESPYLRTRASLFKPKNEPCFFVFERDRVESGLDVDLAKENGGLTIKKDDLWVAAVELQALRKAELGIDSIRKDKELFHSHENRSGWLARLDDFAFELWGEFNPIKAAKFNSIGKVAVYLESHLHFPKTHAERAARMIFPDEKLNPLGSKAAPYRAAMLQDLIDLWGAACQERSYQKGEHEAALYKRAVEDWFNGAGAASGLVKFVELKKTAAALVMPDNAPFNRARPKN